VVVGRGAADGQVELVQRAGGVKQDLPSDALKAVLVGAIEAERVGLPAV
jgi:prolyl-tRNA synthetase